MQKLTPEGHRLLEEIARRNGVSLDAAIAVLHALAIGHGTQAQFNHPDLGGMGQWSQGGMIMIGDMFNQGLKHRVEALCNELSRLLKAQSPAGAAAGSQSQNQSGDGVSLFVAASGSPNSWWPAELGTPASQGAQTDLRYAWFAKPGRLAIQRDSRVQVYDTGDHIISGISQQQGGDQSLTFTSQFGVVRIADLPLVPPQPDPAEGSVEGAPPEAPTADDAPTDLSGEPPRATPAAASPDSSSKPPPASVSPDDLFRKIEWLSDLHQKGILSDVEFSAKKAELLSRI